MRTVEGKFPIHGKVMGQKRAKSVGTHGISQWRLKLANLHLQGLYSLSQGVGSLPYTVHILQPFGHWMSTSSGLALALD